MTGGWGGYSWAGAPLDGIPPAPPAPIIPGANLWFWILARRRRNAVVIAPNLKQAIVAALSAHGPTLAIIGDNLYPGMIPQTANLSGSAALGYRFVSNLRATALARAGGLQSPRVRFRVASYVMADCENCVQVLRNLFQGMIGPLAALPIRFVTLENEVDGYDEPLPGSDLGTHTKEFDFVFKLPETIPTNA